MQFLKQQVLTFVIKKKIKSMGTACICYKPQPQSQPLHPLGQQHLQIGSNRRDKQKDRFNDIANEDDDQVLSQLDLNCMRNQLDRYLVEFQLHNGVITKRFTQRLLREHQQVQEINNFQHLLQMAHQSKPTLQPSNKENELYLPLTHQNNDSYLEPSYSQHGEENKSCLLSLSSRILHQSLFTDRNYKRLQFYNKYNNIGEIRLQKWCDNKRQTYQYQPAQIQELQQKYFDSKFITCLHSLHHYWQTHFIHLLTHSSEPSGFKIYLNGDQKRFPLRGETLVDVYEQLVDRVQELDIAHLIYLLAGWIPEHISLGEVKNYRAIFQRLDTNLNQGNTLINFTRDTKFGKEYATLSRIDFKNQIVYILCNNKKTTIPTVLLEYNNQKTSQMGIAFSNFIELYDLIDLNWNPFIYDFNCSCESILSSQNKTQSFILIIPPSSQDLQIRLFLETHQDLVSIQSSPVLISLYEYDGISDAGDGEPIRTIEANQFIYSDVFIFQYCKDKSQYLLTVQFAEEGKEITDELYFTLSLYSFAQMKFKELQKKPCLVETNLITRIGQQNMGFGINSPYFNKNLQFSVEVEEGSNLQIGISASKQLIYEICIIPDPKKQKNLTKLKLQDIINNSQISGQKRGKGSFLIKTIFSHYLLMINAYSTTNEQISIGLKLYRKQKGNKQYTLSLQEIKLNYQSIFSQEVKWLPTHSGPRKRLKSNSINSFQPLPTFVQFFKNPVIDKKLIKGSYQFFVKSQTFRQYFDSVENYQDKNSCEPPALSMAIFQCSEDKKFYKIIADDAFYVPFGVGFWTQSIDLQEGVYRFVFPKMDKGFSKGLFGIIKN